MKSIQEKLLSIESSSKSETIKNLQRNKLFSNLILQGTPNPKYNQVSPSGKPIPYRKSK